MLAQRDEIAFVQLVCFACNIQTLALVTGLPAIQDDEEAVVSGPGDGSPAGPGRAGRRRKNEPISEDDVLDMRKYLADYEGDIVGLLEGSDRRRGGGNDRHRRNGHGSDDDGHDTRGPGNGSGQIG